MGKVKKVRKSLRQIIEEQAQIIKEQARTIEELRAENAYLRAELAKRDATITMLHERIIRDGLDYHENLVPLKKPSRGKTKRRPGHNLLLRLCNRADDVLRFLYNPDVPFTNNLSEQSLRMIKVKQKISGCFRTIGGAKMFLAIHSYTATAKKQGLNIINSLICTF